MPAGEDTWHAQAAPLDKPWSPNEAALVDLQEELKHDDVDFDFSRQVSLHSSHCQIFRCKGHVSAYQLQFLMRYLYRPFGYERTVAVASNTWWLDSDLQCAYCEIGDNYLQRDRQAGRPRLHRTALGGGQALAV